MAVKRKLRKPRLNPVARLKPRGTESASALKAAEFPEGLLDDAAVPESRTSSVVMLVITLVSLSYIGFIAWCVAQMPAK
ncbi:MAG: hypothetical protein HOP19_05810 [Acidobacteria bacterium]|nr:hypothetical protein [Acidobacteriota bacterium]